jgi:uncharacterized RDD family membrane protein YckC
VGDDEPSTDAGDAAANEYALYRVEDYAGLLRRVGATAVDLCVLVLVWGTVTVMLHVSGVIEFGRPDVPVAYHAAMLVFAFLYLTWLKKSAVRTPGYWVTGLRIVDLKGQPPSMFLMSLRQAWWALGPVNPLVDLFFMSGDDCRQTLRDKLVGTYVIKKDAQPVGRGRRTIGRIGFMGMMIMYPTVLPPAPPALSDAAAA